MTIAFTVLEGQQRGLHEGKYEYCNLYLASTAG